MSTKAMQKRFFEEFKIEAVRQMTEHGHKVANVAASLGVSTCETNLESRRLFG